MVHLPTLVICPTLMVSGDIQCKNYNHNIIFVTSDHNSYSQKSASSGNHDRPFKRSKVIRKSSSQEPPAAVRQRLNGQESATSRNLRKKSHSETSSDGDVQSSAGSCKWTSILLYC